MKEERIKCPYSYKSANIGCIYCLVSNKTNKCPGYIKRVKNDK